jgi:hypothetical protein
MPPVKRRLLFLFVSYLIAGCAGTFTAGVYEIGWLSVIPLMYDRPGLTVQLILSFPYFCLDGLARYHRFAESAWVIPVRAIAFLLSCRVLARALPRPFAEGLCPKCGYDLRATPDRCPECGTVAKVP